MRVDYSTYSRFEFQPGFRLLYTPNQNQSLWVAWSRAVRVPSRYDRDIRSDAGNDASRGIPINSAMFGSHSMRSEVEKGPRRVTGSSPARVGRSMPQSFGAITTGCGRSACRPVLRSSSTAGHRSYG
jgi:hypothetical protein